MKPDTTPFPRLPASPPAKSVKWPIVLGVALICALAFGLRCLHLLNDDHFFVVSPDSYYFHKMAKLLLQNETYFYPTHNLFFPIATFSGITYPLALLATLLATFTPASTTDSLELVSKLLPPALAVATTVVLYLAAARMYGRTVGLLAALSWALVQVGILHQAAGYLDRDCLSLLLVVAGVFSFYFLSDPRISVRFGRWNWVAPVLFVICIEALLYIEWGFLGPAILVAVLVGFLLAQLLKDIVVAVVPSVLQEDDLVRMTFNFAKGSLTHLAIGLKGSLARTVAFVVVLNLIAVAFRPSIFRTMYFYAVKVFGGTVSDQLAVGELQGMGLGDILVYSFLLIPAAIGIYTCAKRRGRADLLTLGWFTILFFLGLFSRRLFIYAAPAVCILSGVGFATLLSKKGIRASLSTVWGLALVDPRGLVPYLRLGLAIILVLATLYASISFGYSFASTPPAAPDTEWHDALIWLQGNTDHDAVIMTWWNYGYWILDVAQRVPVVDNGVHWDAYDRDIARVYCATEDFEASAIMRQYGAEYLVFSTAETSILPTITLKALNVSYGDTISIPPELEDSLYARSFSDTFHSDSGLQRVYFSGGATDTTLAILYLS